MPQGTLRAAQEKLLDAKANLAALEAEVPYLLGKAETACAAIDPSGRYLVDQEAGAATRRVELRKGRPEAAVFQGPTAERIRAALGKPFTYVPEGKQPVRIGGLILCSKDAFEKDNRGLVVNVNNIDKIGGPDEPLPAPRFDQVPFGAALEWIEDSLPGSRIVIRDYGIVIVPKDQLPPGGAYAGRFLA